jgi:hypothetical protein
LHGNGARVKAGKRQTSDLSSVATPAALLDLHIDLTARSHSRPSSVLHYASVYSLFLLARGPSTQESAWFTVSVDSPSSADGAPASSTDLVLDRLEHARRARPLPRSSSPTRFDSSEDLWYGGSARQRRPVSSQLMFGRPAQAIALVPIRESSNHYQTTSIAETHGVVHPVLTGEKTLQ